MNTFEEATREVERLREKYELHSDAVTLEELAGCYDMWRDRAFKAAEISDWLEAARCFQTTAFYDSVLAFLKRNAASAT